MAASDDTANGKERLALGVIYVRGLMADPNLAAHTPRPNA